MTLQAFNICVETHVYTSATSAPRKYYTVVKETVKSYQNVCVCACVCKSERESICASWNSFSDAYICSQSPCQLTALFHLLILCYNIHPSICPLIFSSFLLFSFFISFLLSCDLMLLLSSPVLPFFLPLHGDYEAPSRSDISSDMLIDNDAIISIITFYLL